MREKLYQQYIHVIRFKLSFPFLFLYTLDLNYVNSSVFDREKQRKEIHHFILLLLSCFDYPRKEKKKFLPKGIIRKLLDKKVYRNAVLKLLFKGRNNSIPFRNFFSREPVNVEKIGSFREFQALLSGIGFVLVANQGARLGKGLLKQGR